MSIPPNREQLARLIDHTLLSPDATEADILKLCDEAAANNFAAVSVNATWTALCARRLAGTGIPVDVTVGFPFGATTTHAKVEEARQAVRDGAGEIDMVINVGALKSGFSQFVEDEIAAVVHAVNGLPVKVILKASLLSQDEKIAVCQMSVRAGAAFVKTSTGYDKTGATVDDVRLMRQVVGDRAGVKAAGGIRTYAQTCALLGAGANRIGASASLQILAEAPEP